MAVSDFFLGISQYSQCMLLFAARNANDKPREVQKDKAENRKGMVQEKMQVDADKEQDKESVVDENPKMDVGVAAALDLDSGLFWTILAQCPRHSGSRSHKEAWALRPY
jgi:hypothetical protein